ncbi:hypothetical protein BJ944DRAFT_286587 [Cunninghamella echinulata]|nr:hypothetical protein BJ944DRAFT_286587 [Cunninghamella echinulata]
MKFATISSLLLLSISSALAQNYTTGGISIINPALGAVVTAPSQQIIKYEITDKSVTTIDAIVLMGGQSTNLSPFLLIDTAVPVSADGIYNWNVPKNVETGPAYSIRFKTSKGDTYSPYFSVIGQAPGTGGINGTSIDFNNLPTKTGSSASPTGSNGSTDSNGQQAGKSAGESLKAGVVSMVGAGVAAAALLL